ncbi:MAG: quinolinate synthase NadA [Desulfurococcales archaeon]|nr:quinolinate synthase NadA [Desulfurococcales archaeon]
MGEGSVSRLRSEIEALKKKRNAVILAHNYQVPEVQDVADFVGDSLELAKKALEVDADVIVFAGVRFMAETAAILNPDKTVLHPDPTAGCPLADFLSADDVRRAREEHPNTPLVLYINSGTEAKALADYIVTSSSASKLVSKLSTDKVLFGPDKNLAGYVAEVTGKEVIPVPRHGHCPVHEYLIDEVHLELAKSEHPGATVLVHPEVRAEVRRMADFVGSTSQMLRAVGTLQGKEFILGTEEGLSYRARVLYPDKKVYPLNPKAVCVNMKKITLLKIVDSLNRMKPKVVVEPALASRVREVLEESLKIIR